MSTLTILDLNRTIFIPCDCKGEVLVIEYDHETKTADVAMYENAKVITYRLSIWQRVRYAMRCLVYGRPYGDQLIMTQKQLKSLYEFLNTLDL